MYSSYVMRHNELKLNETPNYDFLGQPINAFHFVRHVASGWTDVRQNVISDDVISLKEDLGKHKILKTGLEILSVIGRETKLF